MKYLGISKQMPTFAKWVIVVVLYAIGQSVYAQNENVIIDGIVYEIDKEESVAKITDASDVSSFDIVIPSYVVSEGKEYPVTEIDLERQPRECPPFYVRTIKFPSTLKRVNCSWPMIREVYVDNMSVWCNIEFPNIKTYSSTDQSSHDVSIEYRWTITNPMAYGAKLFVNEQYSRDITIPKDITCIKDNAYIGGDFDVITFEGPVSSLGRNSFLNCKVKAFNITDVRAWCKVEAIECDYFYNNSSTVLWYCYDSKKNIYKEGFKLCPFENGTKLLINGSDDGNLVIPEGTIEIGWGFRYCESISSIMLPETLLFPGSNMYKERPFYGCTNITSVKVAKKYPMGWWTTADFSSTVYSNATLYVPVGTAYKYQKQEPWSLFKEIIEDPTLTRVEKVEATGPDYILRGNVLSFPEEMQQSLLIIYDIAGNIVYEGMAQEQVLSPGLYIISFNNQTTKLFVK